MSNDIEDPIFGIIPQTINKFLQIILKLLLKEGLLNSNLQLHRLILLLLLNRLQLNQNIPPVLNQPNHNILVIDR